MQQGHLLAFFARMRALAFLLFIGVSYFNVHAQRNQSVGARAGAMGEAAVALEDVWSVHQNQAALGFQEDLAFGVNYKNYFFIPDFGNAAFASAIPLSFGVFGVSYYSLGTSNYRENEYGLAFSKAFGEVISFGMQVNYAEVRFGENYGQKGSVTGEFGVLAKVTDELSFGAHIYNPTQTRFSDFDNEKIPTILKTGLAYEISEKSIFVLEAQKEIDAALRAKTGFELAVAESIEVRLGVLTHPLETTFGFGFELGNLKLDLASSYHSVLGLSPQASLSFDL